VALRGQAPQPQCQTPYKIKPARSVPFDTLQTCETVVYTILIFVE
jgi:hypothetical protein